MNLDFLTSEIYWLAFQAIVTLIAVVVALATSVVGILQGNRRERNAQELQMDQDMPIVFLNPGPKLHKNGGIRLDLMNVGKGIAKDVFVFLEEVEVDGNFSMHTFMPTDSSQLEIKSIDTRFLEDKKRGLVEKVRKLSEPNELTMKITYSDIHGRKFLTEGIIFEKNEGGDYVHDRGKWSFGKQVSDSETKSKKAKFNIFAVSLILILGALIGYTAAKINDATTCGDLGQAYMEIGKKQLGITDFGSEQWQRLIEDQSRFTNDCYNSSIK